MPEGAGSPAARAGVRPGDIIVRVGAVSVEDVGGLQGGLTEDSIGRPLELSLVRGSAVTSLSVVPVELEG